MHLNSVTVGLHTIRTIFFWSRLDCSIFRHVHEASTLYFPSFPPLKPKNIESLGIGVRTFALSSVGCRKQLLNEEFLRNAFLDHKT